MSLQIPIQKDIGEYQEKIVGKMSLRTLACVSLGFASAIAAAAIVYFGLGIEVGNATLPVMAAALPFWLAGFWRPFGMKLEEFLPLLWEHSMNSQTMLYDTGVALAGCACTGPVAGKPFRKARRRAKRKGAEVNGPEQL